MSRKLLILLLLIVTFSLKGQDTVRTNYPGSEKVWKKVFNGAKKSQDLIYWENGREWMTAKYDTADVEYWKWYHENGNPYFEATIIRDELQGLYKIWYESGQLAEEITFLNHLEDGPAIFYYRNGTIAAKGSYHKGKMIGDWKFYDKDGLSFNGKWVWPFAADTSSLRMEGQIKDHQRLGSWKYRTTAGGKKPKVFIEEY
ncbi:hypothetical protein BFP97_18410 [Roseivirga sp. 4D4]|uniref:toxin-antitoxin system YwqK family antitoxin n=1 Tax=Roseivirga sp. 4D4 TaxID=1889784 RepID=UPI000853C4BB|nr:hypothetical protein [Roseivirga sp. 4D4]OEK03374.1 hypothetical protein BFP97_18410 [Roseivirga sp. 4D4]